MARLRGRPRKAQQQNQEPEAELKHATTATTSTNTEGVEKLQELKKSLSPIATDPAQPEGAARPRAADLAGAAEPVKKPVAGIFRGLYPLVCDLLCHILSKEPLTDDRKKELLESVGEDLDEAERKYIPDTIAAQPGAKALTVTTCAVMFQPKAKKADKKDAPGSGAEYKEPVIITTGESVPNAQQ